MYKQYDTLGLFDIELIFETTIDVSDYDDYGDLDDLDDLDDYYDDYGDYDDLGDDGAGDGGGNGGDYADYGDFGDFSLSIGGPGAGGGGTQKQTVQVCEWEYYEEIVDASNQLVQFESEQDMIDAFLRDYGTVGNY